MAKKRKVTSKAATKAAKEVTSARVLRSEAAARKKQIKAAMAEFKSQMNQAMRNCLSNALG